MFPEFRRVEQKMNILWEFLRFNDMTKTSQYRNVVEKRKKCFLLNVKWDGIFDSLLDGEAEMNKILLRLKPLTIKKLKDFARRVDTKFEVIDPNTEY